MPVVGRLDQYASMIVTEFDEISVNKFSISIGGTCYSNEFIENVDITYISNIYPAYNITDDLVAEVSSGIGLSYPNPILSANVFAPYDIVYDEFAGVSYGPGKGTFMRRDYLGDLIVYNEIDEITDFRDIVRSGLILDLDAGMNSSFNNTGTTWNDLSGNGNNGTLTNGPTYDSSNGGSIIFDGVDDKATTNITSFGNNTTWEAWVNRTTNANAYNMFMGRTLPYFGLRTSEIIFSNTIGGSQQTLNSTGFTPSNNTWYYLAFTTEYDGANTIPKIYINGVLNNSTTFTGAQGGSTVSFTIGEGRSTTAWYPFNGKVSNVKIYNRTLTATEVLQNYNALKHRFGL